MRDDIPDFPELAELDVVRHFTRLSQWNYGIDSGFFPLGSCTMKYNPKVNEAVARAARVSPRVHPRQRRGATCRACSRSAAELEAALAEISGLDRVTLQPAAGAQGEFVGVRMISAYHRARGDTKRTRVLIPDTAHGTNPASAALNGLEVVEVKSGADGVVHPEALAALADERTAALMLTNPNTLGLFESHVEKLAEVIHGAGGARVPGRREHERAARHREARPHGRRRDALQPAQDVLDTARRRRAGLRSGGGAQQPGAVPARRP